MCNFDSLGGTLTYIYKIEFKYVGNQLYTSYISKKLKIWKAIVLQYQNIRYIQSGIKTE